MIQRPHNKSDYCECPCSFTHFIIQGKNSQKFTNEGSLCVNTFFPFFPFLKKPHHFYNLFSDKAYNCCCGKGIFQPHKLNPYTYFSCWRKSGFFAAPSYFRKKGNKDVYCLSETNATPPYPPYQHFTLEFRTNPNFFYHFVILLMWFPLGLCLFLR